MSASANSEYGFTSPQDAFRWAAELARTESAGERENAMSTENFDRLSPDIKHFDYAATRLEILARSLDILANMASETIRE